MVKNGSEQVKSVGFDKDHTCGLLLQNYKQSTVIYFVIIYDSIITNNAENHTNNETFWDEFEHVECSRVNSIKPEM